MARCIAPRNQHAARMDASLPAPTWTGAHGPAFPPGWVPAEAARPCASRRAPVWTAARSPREPVVLRRRQPRTPRSAARGEHRRAVPFPAHCRRHPGVARRCHRLAAAERIRRRTRPGHAARPTHRAAIAAPGAARACRRAGAAAAYDDYHWGRVRRLLHLRQALCRVAGGQRYYAGSADFGGVGAKPRSGEPGRGGYRARSGRHSGNSVRRRRRTYREQFAFAGERGLRAGLGVLP